MSFALTLAEDVVEVEAGATTPVGLTVVNRGDATDRYEVEVEGIDPEWRFVPVPTFSVEPGEGRSEKLFLKPPRLPESVAGAYPFVVRVRSLESGEARTAQGLLKLQAFHHVTLEIAPKKGVVSPTTKRNDFRLSLVNLGNSEHTFGLTAQDPDDRCAYEFDHDAVELGPGQGKEVGMVATPKQTPLLSSGRLIGFSVFARSLGERGVAATAQAQLEQRSPFSPASLVVLAIAAAALGGWWAVRPKPPTVNLYLNPAHALAGTNVEVRYETHNADHVRITMGDEIVYEGLPSDVPLSVALKGKGDATFTAVATHEGRNETAQDIEHVRVDEPVVADAAVVDEFSTRTPRIKLGTSFIANWKVRNATRVALAPIADNLSPDLEQLEITPTVTGEQTYTLIATNADGASVRKKLKVQVYDESDAQILAFSAEPNPAREVDGGRIVLTWTVSGADLVELKLGGDSPRQIEGNSKEVTLAAKTTCTLIVTDSKGRKRSSKITVGYEKAPPPPVDPPITTTTGGDPPPADPPFPDRVPPISRP